MEDLPAFLRFAPVPVRARDDGWWPDLQIRFILDLARGVSVDQAARKLGPSRQSAYSLRHRAGGESFARAWDAAVRSARERRAAASAEKPEVPGGIATLSVPGFHRRLVG